MAATLCQVMGFVLSLLGVVGIIAAAVMDQWVTEDPVGCSVINFYSGPWRSCVRQSSGFTECRPYFTIQELPAALQAVRVLTIVGVVLGAIGCLTGIFSLNCLIMGNTALNIKATMTSGIMFLLAGVCGIAGVSAFAYLVGQRFQFKAYLEGGLKQSNAGGSVSGINSFLTLRYSFGPALYVGWTGAAILVIGGILMCVACRRMSPDRKNGPTGWTTKQPLTTLSYTLV